jgi:acetoacetyl-CoA synthetase
VWRGELQVPGLAMAVDVFGEDGKPVRGEPGSSVCTETVPRACLSRSGTIPDGSKYRAAYFEHYPGVWRHGDWAELTEHGGMIITGRQRRDAQPWRHSHRNGRDLPPGGATAEIVESLVIGQDIGDAKERD